MPENQNADREYPVVLPTAPGANPSSFPDVALPVYPAIAVPAPNYGRDSVDLPDDRHVAPNGAVIEEPNDNIPEVLPPHEYTPEKEDLNLLIM